MPTREQRIAGRVLRYRLTLVLRHAGQPMTVRELHAAVEQLGHTVPGRPSKTISDALRQEVRRGRVRRWGRSTYVVDRIPESTVRWMRDTIARHQPPPQVDSAAS